MLICATLSHKMLNPLSMSEITKVIKSHSYINRQLSSRRKGRADVREKDLKNETAKTAIGIVVYVCVLKNSPI